MSTFGSKTESTKGIGSIIKCMGLGKSSGPMGESMKEITRTIRNMVKGLFIGPTGASMLEGGKMGNSMARANILCKMARRK